MSGWDKEHSPKRVGHILKYIDLDTLSDAQERLVLSIAQQFERNGRISDRQLEVLEDIYRQANEAEE